MTPERAEYLQKLGNQIASVDKILTMDSGTLLNNDAKKQLKKLKADAESVYKKLNSDEFEVAIVGLEKAGKSTFANALMKNNILPTKDARCTFTSTRIEYSDSDNAVVSFYTYEKFNNDFKDKLAKMGVENPEKYTFETISKETYEKLCDKDKVERYKGSIHEDILSIIEHSSTIKDLLGQDDIFFGPDEINSKAGKSSGLIDYITGEAEARAVKQVIIKSSQLLGMKNAVIYDVPGFNSPTELHKIQTKERMKSADAIVVVADGSKPSITGESLAILSESDDEGNPLSDKLFVFANKIEGAADIGKNIEDTKKEWTSKKFVSENHTSRIIFGSALAYLKAENLVDDTEIGNSEMVYENFLKRKNELDNGDGIEAMRKKLVEYNNNERFEVLKRRAGRIWAEINNVFADIRKENSIDGTESYSSAQAEQMVIFVKSASNKAIHALKELREEIRTNTTKDSPLSNRIREYIDSNLSVDACRITDKEINEIKLDNGSIQSTFSPSDFENRIRDKRFKEMYNSFSEAVLNFADNQHDEYAKKILEIVLEAIGVDKNSGFYEEISDELIKQLSKFRNELIPNNNCTSLYYQSLIERYSRDLYEVLIMKGYNLERLDKFYKAIGNFFSLSVFYKQSDDEDDLSYAEQPLKDQKLTKMLLFHDMPSESGIATPSSDASAKVTDINGLLTTIQTITDIAELSAESVELVKSALKAVDNNSEKIISVVSEAFEQFAGINPTDGVKQTKLKKVLEALDNGEAIAERVSDAAETVGATAQAVYDIANKESFIAYYREFHNEREKALNKLPSAEDICNEFYKDVEILRDVLGNAFIRAINIETPFLAREMKSIEDIIDYIDSDDNNFSSFLAKYYKKIMYRENEKLEKERIEKETNNTILKEIDVILSDVSAEHTEV